MRRILNTLLLLNICTVIVLFFFRNTIPPLSTFNPLLQQPPIQTNTYKRPFYVDTKEFRFYIEPLYNYKIYGLVVSKYNARKSYLARIDKSLNVTDVCVIWSANVFNQHYQKGTFYSGEFTCFFNFKDNESYQAWRNNQANGFKNDQISNNHLITEDTQLGKRLRDINIGDQIYLEGYLSKYGASPQQIYRGTSTTRTDTGNGACETLYVTYFQTLSHNLYRLAFNYALISLLCIFLLWFAYQMSPFTWKNNPEMD